MDKTRYRACGLLFCYNEENILRDTLTYYLSEGIDLVVIDNGSTDSSLNIVNGFRNTKERFAGKVIDLVHIKTEGYEWVHILRQACGYMHKNLQHYDWILVVDADSFYDSPVKEMPLLEFLGLVQSYGYNVVNGKLYEFYPTEKDDPKVASAIERIRYCKNKHEELLYVNEKYHRIFQYHPTVDFYTRFGHIVERDKRRVLNKVRYIYKHYPWVSFEHGVKKIFKDRKPRYVERKSGSLLHKQWMGMLPIEKDFIWRSKDLSCYNAEQVLISRKKFLWIMRMGRFSDLLGSLSLWVHFFRPCRTIKSFPRYIKNGWEAVTHILNALPYANAGRAVRALAGEFKKDIKKIDKGPTGVKIDSFLQEIRIKMLSALSVIFQHPIALSYPANYHFLMTNFCNAACVFCNQQERPAQRKEINLDMFKLMVSHIPPGSPEVFYFSGGGEPLLCRDIIPIIKVANLAFPATRIYMRTNGILIEKFAKELSELKIDRLEISVHGPQDINDFIIQNAVSAKIFDGIAALNQHLKAKGKNMVKVFCPALTRMNIEQLPGLIKKAAELGVQEVDAFFCRFYPGFEDIPGAKLKKEDSLYFHKELHNDIIRKAKKLAKALSVRFEHEPLFFDKFKEKPCLQPWRTVLVDWEGDIYPCVGGEAWFEKEVKSGKYYFGNLLKEHVYEFWTNLAYVMIRRTCNRQRRENFIPECADCQNTICFKGADDRKGHFLERFGQP